MKINLRYIFCLLLLPQLHFFSPFSGSDISLAKYSLCKRFIGDIYPYTLYQSCGNQTEYFFQLTSNQSQEKYAEAEMNELFKTIIIQDQFITEECQRMQISIVSKHHFVLISSNKTQNEQEKILRLYQIDVNSFLYKNIKKNNITKKQVSSLFYETRRIKLQEKSLWATSYNGSTLRIVLMTETQSEDKQKMLNLTIKDAGFNIHQQNPPYNIAILRNYINLSEIKHFKVSTLSNGNFYLFIGDEKRIKIFQIRLYGIFFLSEFDKFTFFSTLDQTYAFVSFQTLYFYKIEKKIVTKKCSYNVSEIENIQEVNSSYLKLCQSNNCSLINQKCQIVKNEENNQTISNQTGNDVLQLQKETFFPTESYDNKYKFASLYADNLMKEKLLSILKEKKKIFKMQESVDEEEKNCDLEDPQQGKLEMKITFQKKKKWEGCRLFFPSSKTYVLQKLETEDAPKNPYYLIICKFTNSSFQIPDSSIKYNSQRKCYFSQLTLERMILSSNSLYRMYFINMGSTYNLQIKDINKAELERIRTVFFYVILGIFFVLLFIILRAFIKFLFIYYGWSNSEPRYRYPLNPIQLKIKLKRLKEKGYFQYYRHKQQTNGEVTCCFCLQDAQQKNRMMELYCHHQFHAVCFENWVKSEEFCKCPVCKRGFTEDELRTFMNSQMNLKESEESQVY